MNRCPFIYQCDKAVVAKKAMPINMLSARAKIMRRNKPVVINPREPGKMPGSLRAINPPESIASY